METSAATLGELSQLQARAFGGKTALDFEGRSTTFEAFELKAGQVANGLIALGLAPGDRVGYLGKNSDAYFNILFGAAKDGCTYISDRVNDLIISGGENVYPAEVERAILGCPGVADVTVIGVPDPKWGEAVKAVVFAATGASPDSADVISWARNRLPGCKTPKSVDSIAALPHNASGKVVRRMLREPYWAGAQRR